MNMENATLRQRETPAGVAGASAYTFTVRRGLPAFVGPAVRRGLLWRGSGRGRRLPLRWRGGRGTLRLLRRRLRSRLVRRRRLVITCRGRRRRGVGHRGGGGGRGRHGRRGPGRGCDVHVGGVLRRWRRRGGRRSRGGR